MIPNPFNEPRSRGPVQPLLQLGRPRLRVIRMLALLVATLIGAGCGGGGSAGDSASEDDSDVVYNPGFRTEYEPDETAGTPPVSITRLTFQNLGTGQSPIDFDIQYRGGSVPDRHATLVADPTQPGNHVLRFWLRNAVFPTAFQSHTLGRIQTAIEFPSPVEELYARQRVYLHPDIAHFLSYPPNGDTWWLSIVFHELWAGADWLGHPNSARLSLNLAPDFDRGKLFFIASLDTTSTLETFWSEANRDFALPIGEWFTLEIAYRMGNDASGRFILKAQADSASPTTVFDVTNWTYSPYADQPGGTGPVGLTHWNPQMMYSSDNVLHHIRDSGGVAQVYWDDFEFGFEWPPGW